MRIKSQLASGLVQDVCENDNVQNLQNRFIGTLNERT